jgi:mannose-6-phosphate isomerase-like protein (cupin superfamily)
MTASLRGIELDYGGVLLELVETATENGGAQHVQRARYSPRSQPPPYHCHPRQHERFEVLEGALHFHVDGADRIINAGEAIVVAKGSFHRAHNPGDVPTLAIWTTRPALRTAEFFVTMNRATRGRARPRLVDAAAILREYRDEFQLHRPPLLIQRVLFSCLAPFGRAALTP